MPITSWAPRLAERNARPHTQAGMRAAGMEEVVARRRVAPQHGANAQHEREVDDDDDPVDRREGHRQIVGGRPRFGNCRALRHSIHGTEEEAETFNPRIIQKSGRSQLIVSAEHTDHAEGHLGLFRGTAARDGVRTDAGRSDCTAL